MKLYTFIVNYGYPYIIDQVKGKYKKFVKKEIEKERTVRIVQKHVIKLLHVG